MSPPTLAPVQLAYHVPDPEAAAVRCAREFGWGPFYLLEHIALQSCLYRGKPAVFDHTSAYGQAGETMVELITQHDDTESVLRDMYASHQTGIHHVAYFVPDLQAALDEYQQQGYDIALDAITSSLRFAMVDARSSVGHMLEFYEPTQRLLRFYDFIRTQSRGWDGTRPLRRLTT